MFYLEKECSIVLNIFGLLTVPAKFLTFYLVPQLMIENGWTAAQGALIQIITYLNSYILLQFSLSYEPWWFFMDSPFNLADFDVHGYSIVFHSQERHFPSKFPFLHSEASLYLSFSHLFSLLSCSKVRPSHLQYLPHNSSFKHISSVHRRSTNRYNCQKFQTLTNEDRGADRKKKIV